MFLQTTNTLTQLLFGEDQIVVFFITGVGLIQTLFNFSMTSFGWKRKTGEKVCRPSSSAFENESKEDGHDGLGNTLADGGEFLGPPNKLIRLEDAIAKSRRLKQEGAVLAEAERWLFIFNLLVFKNIYRYPVFKWCSLSLTADA